MKQLCLAAALLLLALSLLASCGSGETESGFGESVSEPPVHSDPPVSDPTPSDIDIEMPSDILLSNDPASSSEPPLTSREESRPAESSDTASEPTTESGESQESSAVSGEDSSEEPFEESGDVSLLPVGDLRFSLPSFTLAFPIGWKETESEDCRFSAENPDGASLIVTETFTDDTLHGLTSELIAAEMATRLGDEFLSEGVRASLSVIRLTIAEEEYALLRIVTYERVYLQLYLPSDGRCLVVTSAADSESAARAIWKYAE